MGAASGGEWVCFVRVPSFLGARLDPEEPAVAGDGEPLDGLPGGGDGGGADRRPPGPVRRGRLLDPRGVRAHRGRLVATGRELDSASGGALVVLSVEVCKPVESESSGLFDWQRTG